ncbi:hypothetical protein [Paraburkholderia xenovorans]|uniref:hypothetical protein n=1 Tax=Paraburkholderia xenovorans TaxID=36873 RepID=UPI00003C4C55|nr:hypothetical protein [Paraburkholderia xenovorans]
MGSLIALIQRGACQINPHTVEAELAILLEQYDNLTTRGDDCTLVSPFACKPAKLCDRPASCLKLNSMVLGPK